MAYTYNNCIDLFKNIKEAHFQIKSFGHGEEYHISGALTKDRIAPMFWVQPVDSVTRENTVERTFTLRVFDLVHKDESNEDDVLSDCELILNDIIKMLQFNNPGYNLIGDIQLIPFTEKYGDDVTGWQCDVTLETNRDYSFCTIPSFPFVSPETPTGGGSFPGGGGFACSDLLNCSSFTTLQSDVANLIANPITASNGLYKIGQNIKWGGILVEDTQILAANHDIQLGSLVSPVKDFSLQTNSSITLTSGNSTNQTYLYGQSDYLLLGLDNSSSNTIEFFDSGQPIANNGSNNSITISDGLTSKGLVYSSDYSSNFTFESLVSKRYVDNAISANSPSLTSTQIAYGSGTNTITSEAAFNYDDTNDILNVPNISSTNVNATTLNGNHTGTALLNNADLFAFGVPAQPTFEYVRLYSTASKQLSIKGVGNNFAATLAFNGISASRTYTFPNVTGTVALTSDITTALVPYLTSATAATTYVPFTGAASPVNLNTQILTSGAHNILGSAETIYFRGTGTAFSFNRNPDTGVMSSAAGFGYQLNHTQNTTNTSDLLQWQIYNTAGTSVGVSMSMNGLGDIGFGLAANATQRKVRVNQDTAFIDLGSLIGTTSKWAIYGNQTTPSATNYALAGTSTQSTFNAATDILIKIADSTIINLDRATQQFVPLSSTSGAITNFTFTKPNNTGQSTDVAIPGFNYNGGSRTWSATANITNQYENVWGSTTYNAGTSSAISNAYGNYFNAPNAGTNVSIGNNFAIGTNGAIRVNIGTVAGGIVLRDRTTDASAGAIYISQTTPAQNNYTLLSTTNTTVLNGPAVTQMAVGGTAITTLRGATSTTSNNWFVGQQLASTNLPASVEATGVLWSNNSKQFATGTVAIQREFRIDPMTYTAVGASTITNAFGLHVSAGIASTNMTITNNWAFGTSGAAKVSFGASGLATPVGGTSMMVESNTTNYLSIIQPDANLGGIVLGSPTDSFMAYFRMGYTAKDLEISTSTASGRLRLGAGSDVIGITMTATTQNYTPGVSTAGAVTNFTFTKPNNTSQTANTAISGWVHNAGTRAWASTATIANQYENIWNPATYSAASASTITNAFGNYFTAPIASTNVTITNRYSAGFDNSIYVGGLVNATTGYSLQSASVLDIVSTFLRFGVSSFFTDIYMMHNTLFVDGVNINTGTTNGTKLMTLTTQKLGVWGATPIVQPSGAAQAAVTGTAGVLYTATEQTLINDLKTLVNQLRADLVAIGLIKGSA